MIKAHGSLILAYDLSQKLNIFSAQIHFLTIFGFVRGLKSILNYLSYFANRQMAVTSPSPSVAEVKKCSCTTMLML